MSEDFENGYAIGYSEGGEAGFAIGMRAALAAQEIIPDGMPVWKSPHVTVEKWALDDYGIIWAMAQAQEYALFQARHKFIQAIETWVHMERIVPATNRMNAAHWMILRFEGKDEYGENGNGLDWKKDR